MFDGEILRKKFPFKNILDLEDKVQDRVQDKVKEKVGLRKFSPKFFFVAKSLKMSCLMEKL